MRLPCKGCRGIINGNMSITWQNKYYTVISIPTFTLTALAKYWQLRMIMVSQLRKFRDRIRSDSEK